MAEPATLGRFTDHAPAGAGAGMTAGRILVRRTLERVAGWCAALGRRAYTSPLEREHQRWTAVDGDHSLRLDYPLDADSVVVDLGGYRGQWASDVFARFGCRIHVFEPVPAFAEGLRRRFAANPRIAVHQCGLASSDAEVDFYLRADGTSQFAPHGSPAARGALRQAATYLRQAGLQEIALLKINIEGGEYDLLEHLVSSGWIRRVADVQVQFHDCVPQAAARVRRVQSLLAATHGLTYQFPFIWENWRRTAAPAASQEASPSRSL